MTALSPPSGLVAAPFGYLVDTKCLGSYRHPDGTALAGSMPAFTVGARTFLVGEQAALCGTSPRPALCPSTSAAGCPPGTSMPTVLQGHTLASVSAAEWAKIGNATTVDGGVCVANGAGALCLVSSAALDCGLSGCALRGGP